MTTTLQLLQQASQAVACLQSCSDSLIQQILNDTALALLANMESILKANEEDLSRMDTSNPKYDRLKLTESRLRGIAEDMQNVSALPSPLGKTYSETIRPNGMTIRKISVPFGVIGVIYEARPNVTCDVFSLCLKSGNVCVLKGGSDADCSNRALVRIIHQVLEKYQLNPALCTLLPPDREATAELLNAVGLVDLVIPRGSSSLIQYVRDHARIPVIETGAGICHTYFDIAGERKRESHYQQCQDPQSQCLQCFGLSAHPRTTTDRSSLSVSAAKPASGYNLRRRTCLQSVTRKLSTGFTPTSYRRKLRNRILGLQNEYTYGSISGGSFKAYCPIQFEA